MWTYIVVLPLSIVTSVKPPAEIHYKWNYMNYTWPSAKEHDAAIANGDYIPENNAIGGIQVWKNKFYVTTPRWRQGVPVTLGVIPYNPVDGNRSPNIEPFPNWSMQKIGDCQALQNVARVEFDPAGRLWVLNNGHINTLENSKKLCPHRLVVFDLENNGDIILNYEFPKDVVDPDTGHLSSLQHDSTDGGYVYISNSDKEKPSIVVFSIKNRTSWQSSHKTMKATDVNFKIEGDSTEVTKSASIKGIALSAFSRVGPRILYYSPISSLNLFSVSASIVKNQPNDIDAHVKNEGSKGSQSDGSMMTANDELYYGLLQKSSVAKWNTHSYPLLKSQVEKFADSETMQWPGTFALDERTNLWVATSRLQRLFADKVNVDEVNYRIVKLARVGYKDYQYAEDGSVPELPLIESV